MKHDIGLIGLAVMGKNLVLNMERNGFSVAVFNRSPEKTDEFLKTGAQRKNIAGYKTIRDFVASLQTPRRVLLMVKAGPPVDELIKILLPLLEKGDVLIDCGNSLYEDTERRYAHVTANGIHYLGMGVSGGEEGALWGPSIMPGGDETAFKKIEGILQKIAAKSDSGPCVTYVGLRSAGHFVKMVHNGIEYGDMQLIAESYDILRTCLAFTPEEIAEVFEKWNEGALKSYLIEITSKVLRFKESSESPHLIDLILDKAGQKGTGTWTVNAAMREGVAVPTITAAVDARFLSSLKEERARAAALYPRAKKPPQTIKDTASFLAKLEQALYASKICSYAQGFSLMKAADSARGYGLNLAEIARIWKGGCIIRAVFLDKIREAFMQNPGLENLLIDPGFRESILRARDAWKEVLKVALDASVPAPAMSASFAYLTSYSSQSLPANLIQGQRDYFGAHTYERTDRPGIFHTHWI